MNSACPYCCKSSRLIHFTSGIDLHILYNNKISCELFFSNEYKKLLKCFICKNEYINIDGSFCIDGIGLGRRIDVSFQVETYNEDRAAFIGNDLIDYLPNEEMKTAYRDTLEILQSKVSEDYKLAPIRKLLETFVQYEINKNRTGEPKEVHRFHNELKNLKLEEIEGINSEDLYNTLRNIYNVGNHGVHAKNKKTKGKNYSPQDNLNFLELYFMTMFQLPQEEARIQEEFEEKKAEIYKKYHEKQKVLGISVDKNSKKPKILSKLLN